MKEQKLNIFCHIPREGWIVDRLGKEYLKHSEHNVSHNVIDRNTDVIWLYAGWCWNHINESILKNYKVVCTEHHIVKSKFEKEKKQSFLQRDKFVDHYLTYTLETKNFISKYTKKPITIIPHWVNENLWDEFDDTESIREELNLPNDKFIVSSFQRDTEGFDLRTPKLEKGPYIFIDKINHISKIKPLHVLLGGWRRQYIINHLDKMKIDYTYIELPDIKTINKMYCASDLYLMSSREEGGPQAIFESSFLKIPILATKAGQSQNLLHKESLYDFDEVITENKIQKAFDCIKNNRKNVELYLIRNHMKNYDNFFREVVK